MTDLSALHDDEIVAEMQRRLSRSTVGFEGLYSANQLNFRAMWHGIADTIHAMSNEDFDHPHVKRIRERFHELAGSTTLFNPAVFAVNSTYLGVERIEEHQARALVLVGE